MPRRSIFGNGKARGFQKNTSGFKSKSVKKNVIVVRRRASKNHRRNYNNVLNETKSMEDYSNAQINKIYNKYFEEIRQAWWFVEEKNRPYIFLIGYIFLIVLLAITIRAMS